VGCGVSKDEAEGYDDGKDKIVADYGEVDGTRPPICVKLRSYDGGKPRVAITRKGAKGKEYPLKRMGVNEAVCLAAFLIERLGDAEDPDIDAVKEAE